jgi:alkylated DNA nucleotide flippase Atl1
MLPCHRVVNRLGGLSSAFETAGFNEQRLLLEGEGVEFTIAGRVDMEKHMWLPG